VRRLRIFFGDRLLEGFQTQLQLFLRQTLRAGAEMQAFELQQQMTQRKRCGGDVLRMPA
jgi:hypothetical protein